MNLKELLPLKVYPFSSIKQSMSGLKVFLAKHKLLELVRMLTLKAPATTAADNKHKYIFVVFQRK